MSKRKYNRKTKHLLTQNIHTDAGGIDIGAEELVVAVPPGRDSQPVRTFPSFTSDILEMRDWLVSCGITTVAMESTGSYWIPSYDILEEAGIKVCLVNARHVKGVPGKKTDVCDAQWLQQLHTAGLLKASFRPTRVVVAVRQLVRYRSQLVKDTGRHLQHMQKALTEMNVKLHHVFSDLDGVSAMRIIESILAGERDPETLWKLRDKRCRATRETFDKSIQGDWQESQLFILGQCLNTWKQTRESIEACNEKIKSLMDGVEKETGDPPPQAPGAQRRAGKNDPGFDVYQTAYHYYGVDLSSIDGIGAGAITTLMSEVGNARDLLTNFKSGGHFASWLGLCPDNRISGGKVLSCKTRRVVNRLAAALRMSAQGVMNSKSEMGNYCRRMKARLGKAEGTTAVAHKLARLIYALVQSKEPYDEAKAFQINAKTKARRIKSLKKMAKSLGMQVAPA